MTTSAKESASFDPLLCSVEAAKYLQMAQETLMRMVRSREIACVRNSSKKGSPAKFRLSVLNQWIRRHEIAPMRTA
jgi:hypothetical protein